MKAKEAAWEFDDGRSCRLCGGLLTRWNCRWKVFPGICKDCAPPGVLRRRVRRKVYGRLRWQIPRGYQAVRFCACGQELEPHKQMCEECRRNSELERKRECARRRRREARLKTRQGRAERHAAQLERSRA